MAVTYCARIGCSLLDHDQKILVRGKLLGAKEWGLPLLEETVFWLELRIGNVIFLDGFQGKDLI